MANDKPSKSSKKKDNSSNSQSPDSYKPYSMPVNMPNMPPMQPMPNMPSAQPAAPAVDINVLKVKLEDFKKKVVKKYQFTTALVLLAPQASPLIEEDEAVPKEITDTRPMHLVMLIPEEEYKNVPKIKPEILKLIKIIF